MTGQKAPLRLGVYSYLDDATFLMKVAQLSKNERVVIVNCREARTEEMNDRRLVLNLTLDSLKDQPLQGSAKDLTYLISLVGEIDIKLYLERPNITMSRIVTKSDEV